VASSSQRSPLYQQPIRSPPLELSPTRRFRDVSKFGSSLLSIAKKNHILLKTPFLYTYIQTCAPRSHVQPLDAFTQGQLPLLRAQTRATILHPPVQSPDLAPLSFAVLSMSRAEGGSSASVSAYLRLPCSHYLQIHRQTVSIASPLRAPRWSLRATPHQSYSDT
jgi:hypothetical protein